MTTPFRRRHHDDEGAHDRARALTSLEMVEPLDELQSVWLAGHLEACLECRFDREAFVADRDLLRTLRDQVPEPPRDLRARTMAALDHESRARARRERLGVRPSARRGRPSLPFGAAAGALVVLVVVGATVLPSILPTGPDATPGRSTSAFASPEIQPTPFLVPAVHSVGWVQPGLDGSWELVLADVTSLCPRSVPNCQPLGEGQLARPIDLGSAPHGITISPSENQLVVESRAEGSTPGRILVVNVPPEEVPATPGPSEPVTSGSSEPPVTPLASQVAVSPGPTTNVPRGAVEIATGVTVIGETLYSPDGSWLAFSARPSDGSHGPDLYLWRVGAPSAIAITDDHATYFSAWFGSLMLVSHVDVSAPDASASPEASDGGAATADPGSAPGASNDPGLTAEGRATSYLLDPATLARTDIVEPDVWLPVVDPAGRFVAYWSGTLGRTQDGLDWQPAAGSLVLARWSDGVTPLPTPELQPTPDADASTDPGASGPPVLPIGPDTMKIELVAGPVAAFRASFDPTGSRLAVWVGETFDGDVGRLHMVVLDPATGGIDPTIEPLPGVPALRRFTIDRGRLAWVSPSGQDGQESAVQVLGWSGNEFGEVRANPAKLMYLVR
jgi:hypothetical protein